MIICTSEPIEIFLYNCYQAEKNTLIFLITSNGVFNEQRNGQCANERDTKGIFSSYSKREVPE